MRHYFGYDNDGNLRSYEAYGPVGWPHNHCLEDPNCEATSVTSLRETRASDSPYIIDWVLFDCPCDPAQGAILRDCPCIPGKFSSSYVDTATRSIKSKPARTVYVDGVLIQDGETVTRTPGAQVLFKVVASGLPDGSIVNCAQRGQVDVAIDPQWDMTIVGGTTEEKALVAPSQGTKGLVFIGGAKIRPFSFYLRGFAEA